MGEGGTRRMGTFVIAFIMQVEGVFEAIWEGPMENVDGTGNVNEVGAEGQKAGFDIGNDLLFRTIFRTGNFLSVLVVSDGDELIDALTDNDRKFSECDIFNAFKRHYAPSSTVTQIDTISANS